jgi:hypothetical protein
VTVFQGLGVNSGEESMRIDLFEAWQMFVFERCLFEIEQAQAGLKCRFNAGSAI